MTRTPAARRWLASWSHGEEPSVRTHEIRDILARNSVPFGFYRSDSAEGRQALARLGVDQPAGPVVALFNGIVLVDPGNAEVAEALGAEVRPARSAYDVIIVGAGDRRARFLTLHSPAGFERFAAEVGEPAQTLTLPPPAGPQDFAALAEAAGRHQITILAPPPQP